MKQYVEAINEIIEIIDFFFPGAGTFLVSLLNYQSN